MSQTTGIIPYAALLSQQLKADAPPLWGLMNAQQMVEHLVDFFNISNGKLQMELLSPPEKLPALLAFLHSDKELRENTKAPQELVPETPVPLRFANMDAALNELHESIIQYFNFFGDDEIKTSTHPVFGPLTKKDWDVLHAKHLRHHLRQFGLLPRLS